MAETIIWYVQNKHDLLSVHDQFLAQFNMTQVRNIKRAQKSEWIRHLDVAQEANTKEQTQRSKRQRVITKYMERLESQSEEATQTCGTSADMLGQQ